MSDEQTLIERLESAHNFPDEFTFKLIGENSEDFVQATDAALKRVMPQCRPRYTRKESRKGNHQSVTVDVVVPDAKTVLALYQVLQTVPKLRMLI